MAEMPLSVGWDNMRTSWGPEREQLSFYLYHDEPLEAVNHDGCECDGTADILTLG